MVYLIWTEYDGDGDVVELKCESLGKCIPSLSIFTCTSSQDSMKDSSRSPEHRYIDTSMIHSSENEARVYIIHVTGPSSPWAGPQ